LGVHVVGRGIVFVDLALGQISMLGVAVANYFEKDPTVISIIFTMVGAFLLSFIKIKDKRLKQEAIIGIVYAVASAVTVLFISKAPTVNPIFPKYSSAASSPLLPRRLLQWRLCSALLGSHTHFSEKFFELTEKFENHEVEDIGVFNLWNFLFYLSIGLSIVLAVRIAGVIPVFSYLIIPPVSAILLTRKRSAAVIVALTVSVVGVS